MQATVGAVELNLLWPGNVNGLIGEAPIRQTQMSVPASHCSELRGKEMMSVRKSLVLQPVSNSNWMGHPVCSVFPERGCVCERAREQEWESRNFYVSLKYQYPTDPLLPAVCVCTSLIARCVYRVCASVAPCWLMFVKVYVATRCVSESPVRSERFLCWQGWCCLFWQYAVWGSGTLGVCLCVYAEL